MGVHARGHAGARKLAQVTLQAILDGAANVRALQALEAAAMVREAIRPIRRRQLASLAALVRASPVAERRQSNRRANRPAFDNRRDCR